MNHHHQQHAPHLIDYFSKFGLHLSAANTPSNGLKMIESNSYDLIILDIMLPEMDGFTTCKEIRKNSNIPIIMLTARGEVTDRIVGIELGADDYMSKPFEPRELIARIQSIVKRSKNAHIATPHIYSFKDFLLNTETQSIHVSQKTIYFTHAEYMLLELLVKRTAHPFSRDEIINHLRGIDADIYSRAVDVLVSRTRQKIKPLDYIKTVRGAGYSFVAPEVSQ
jgi:OmpR family response regulator RpaB